MALVVSPGNTFADPGADFMASAGRYWLGRGNPAQPRYRIEEVMAPSVDGAAERRHGFEARDLENLEVVYVQNSADACWAALKSDQDAMANVAVSVAWGGATYPACKCVKFDVVKGPKKTGGGTYRLHCVLSFEQKRLA